MTQAIGIIDQTNPFVRQAWVKQGYGLTQKRRNDLTKLLGQSKEDIELLKINEGRYPAFVAIRWGFAVMDGNRLVGTEKWDNLSNFDKFGNPLQL